MSRSPRDEARIALAGAHASIAFAAIRRQRVFQRKDGSIVAMRDPDLRSALGALEKMIELAGLDGSEGDNSVLSLLPSHDAYDEIAVEAGVVADEADRLSNAFGSPALPAPPEGTDTPRPSQLGPKQAQNPAPDRCSRAAQPDSSENDSGCPAPGPGRGPTED